mgnify:CR=1 FL=1
MRVDIVTKEYPPEIYGGAGVHVTELVAALHAEGSNVSFVALYNSGSGELRITPLSGEPR